MKDLNSIVWSSDRDEQGRAPEMLIVDGDPNGTLDAVDGSMAIDPVTGVLYVKTDSDATSWSAVGNFDPDAPIDFGGLVSFESAEPRLRLVETDAATNAKMWDVDVSSGIFRFRTRTDADAAGATFFEVQRGTGTAVGDMTFTAGSGVGHQMTFVGRTIVMEATGPFDAFDSVYIHSTNASGSVSLAADNGGALNMDGGQIALSCDDAFTMSCGAAVIECPDGAQLISTATNHSLIGIRSAADDAAAAALSPAVPIGGLYRTASVLKIRVA